MVSKALAALLGSDIESVEAEMVGSDTEAVGTVLQMFGKSKTHTD